MKTCCGKEGQEVSVRLLKASAGKAPLPSNLLALSGIGSAHHGGGHAGRMNLKTDLKRTTVT